MVKKVSTILFISLSFLLQYCKQFFYLQCKIENINNKTTTCDCEKKYDNELNKEGSVIPSQKLHFHALTDEFYLIDENDHELLPSSHSRDILRSNILFRSLYCGNIFHPPQI